MDKTQILVLIDKGSLIGHLADMALEAKGRDCTVLGEVIDLVHREPPVEERPAVAGCSDLYTVSEISYRNGEANMKSKVVSVIMGMQVAASGEKHKHLREILERVNGL